MKIWVEVPDAGGTALLKFETEATHAGGSTRQVWLGSEMLQFRFSALFQEGLEIIFENTLQKHPASKCNQPKRRKPYTRKRLRRRRKAICYARQLVKGCFTRGALFEPPRSSQN